MRQVQRTRIAHFEIKEQIALHGVSAVFLAVDERLGRQVSLQIVDTSHASGSRLGTHLLERTRSLSRAQHPVLPVVYEVGELPRATWIAMEHIEGSSLGSDAGTPTASLRVVAPAIRTAGIALDALHLAGVVHGDVRPANIWQTPHEQIYLTSFTTAYETFASNPHSITPQAARCVSPERWRGLQASPASDLYSLACTFYELLTGAAAFGGSDTREIEQSHLRQPPPHLPKGFDEIEVLFQGALRKDPAERYATVEAWTYMFDKGIRAMARQAFVAQDVPSMAAQTRPDSVYSLAFLESVLVVPGSRSMDEVLLLLSSIEPAGNYGVACKKGRDAATDMPLTLVSMRACLPFGEGLVGIGNSGKRLAGLLAQAMTELHSRVAAIRAKINWDRGDVDEHPDLEVAARWFSSTGVAPDDWSLVSDAMMLSEAAR
jgi:serine/threonine protein kinase